MIARASEQDVLDFKQSLPQTSVEIAVHDNTVKIGTGTILPFRDFMRGLQKLAPHYLLPNISPNATRLEDIDGIPSFLLTDQATGYKAHIYLSRSTGVLCWLHGEESSQK